MKYVEYYLPIEWYIAKIDYYINALKNFEVIHKGIHSNQPVLRVYSSSKSFREIKPSSKQWNETKSKYQTRQTIINEIKRLKEQLKAIYNTNYERERPKYLIHKNTTSKLDMNFYAQLIDNECKFENNTDLNFDNHVFRSRLEYATAQVIKPTGIPYKYDCGVHLYTKKVFTDFVLGFPEFNRCVFIEALGALNDQNYVERSANKFYNYSMADYIVGKDVFFLGGTSKTMPDNAAILGLIIHVVQLLCHQYVQRL